MPQEKLTELHEAQKQWLQQVALYRDELSHFKNVLGTIAINNSSTEFKSKVESFQNRFIAQEDWIDRFEHDVKKMEHKIEAQLLSNPVAYNHQRMEYDGKEREGIAQEIHLFHELKEEFQRFASEHL